MNPNQPSLSDIYSATVAGKGNINTTGLTSSKGLQAQFERDPITKGLEEKLHNTFSKIMSQAGSQEHVKTDLKPETADNAEDNILKALKELKDLNAL